jgi:deoxyhypusine synthase
MKHEKQVVVDVLNEYMTLSLKYINEIMVSKLDGIIPESLKDELITRMVSTATGTQEEAKAVMQRYLDEDLSFDDLVRELNESAVRANIRGQVIAQEFYVEFDREIVEFQIANSEKVEAKLKELGLPVPEVTVIPDINTSGGQA